MFNHFTLPVLIFIFMYTIILNGIKKKKKDETAQLSHINFEECALFISETDECLSFQNFYSQN